MLQSVKQLYGAKIGASDGEFGHVRDFYFDDRSWMVRYLVMDTGTWLSRRKVLIPPFAVEGLSQAGKVLRINLTRTQIENSPSMDSHKPVSRQFEEQYYQHYGWPCYWLGDGEGGMAAFPIAESPKAVSAVDSSTHNSPGTPVGDGHLRSTLAVHGYNLEASDGIAGHISDFLIDTGSWKIVQLVIKTGHRISGNEVEIPAARISRINGEDSLVYTDLATSAIEHGIAHPLPVTGTSD